MIHTIHSSEWNEWNANEWNGMNGMNGMRMNDYYLSDLSSTSCEGCGIFLATTNATSTLLLLL